MSDVEGVVKLRVIEFFSGIGGFRAGLDLLQRSSGGRVMTQVVAAFDVNKQANTVYGLNFGEEARSTSLEYISVADIEKLQANCWTMSPPCQPYTSAGKQKGIQDARSNALTNLTRVIGQLKTPPTYIIVENVPNFEISESRDFLVQTLTDLNYEIKEFMLSPIELNIPNHRLRYFLLASRMSVGMKPAPLGPIQFSLERSEPRDQSSSSSSSSSSEITETPLPTRKDPAEYLKMCNVSIQDYLGESLLLGDQTENLLVERRILIRHSSYRFDIVRPDSKYTSCFTKGYGKNYSGSGSFLQTKNMDVIFQQERDQPDNVETGLLDLGLRYFHPQEIARLHGFPASFRFPPSMNLISQWRLLGNSLSVPLVAALLERLIIPPS